MLVVWGQIGCRLLNRLMKVRVDDLKMTDLHCGALSMSRVGLADRHIPPQHTRGGPVEVTES